MAKLFKRGKYYWFDFRFRGTRHQGTTFLKNKENAESYVAAFRTNLVNTGVGLTTPSAQPPLLSVFLKGAFLDNVRQNAKKPRTKLFYAYGVKRLCAHPPFTRLRLDAIDELTIQAYKDARLAVKRAVVTINRELGTLRKALRFAEDCKLITKAPRVRLLPNEHQRDFILDGEMEKRYLALADYPLKQVAILMLDLGLRPGEAVSLRKSSISGSPPTVAVLAGKTVNAKRTLPQTNRTIEVFALCASLFPESEWVFPGRKGQHFTAGAVSNRHTDLRKAHELPAEFVLYSTRHTYGTRLAESGASPFEICYLMGHASIKMSERYIHFAPSSVIRASAQKELFDKMRRGEEVHTEASVEKSKTS